MLRMHWRPGLPYDPPLVSLGGDTPSPRSPLCSSPRSSCLCCTLLGAFSSVYPPLFLGILHWLWDVRCLVAEVVWTSSLTSVVSRWSTFSASLTPSWKPRMKAAVTSSTISACHTSVSTVPPTSQWGCQSLLTLLTSRPLTQWCRVKWRQSSTIVGTLMAKRYVVV